MCSLCVYTYLKFNTIKVKYANVLLPKICNFADDIESHRGLNQPKRTYEEVRQLGNARQETIGPIGPIDLTQSNRINFGIFFPVLDFIATSFFHF